MEIKTFLYVLIVPISIWIVLGLNIEKYFKRNKTNQIIVCCLFLALGMSYLVVNFIVDFYEVSRIIN